MTTTKVETIRQVLNQASPDELADAFRKIKLGDMLSVIKVTVAALTATAAPDITSAAVKAAATIVGTTLESGENLPPIGQLLSLRVTASGTAASVGSYIATDTGGTATLPTGGASAGVGIAKLSDDGTTITFPNTVTAFVVTYRPRAPAAIGSLDTTKFAPSV